MAKEKPIIFNTKMVKAILAGRKTQTRRLVKPHLPNRIIKNVSFGTFPGARRSDWIINYEEEITNYFGHVKPPCEAGDILWVRETWCKECEFNQKGVQYENLPPYYYKADITESLANDKDFVKWRPSIHMPRQAARLMLKVTNVRVERLQDIKEDDAKAEGICPNLTTIMATRTEEFKVAHQIEFRKLWDSIYKSQGFGWDINPWVWVIEFVRL